MIAITGSSGFIGSRLVASLAGEDLRLLVRKRDESLSYNQVVCDFGVDAIPLDALDGVSKVFHLAGFAHDMQDATKVESIYQKINVDVTIELANLAVKAGVKSFVFVSSVKSGGRPLGRRCSDELDQNRSEGVYGRTKREAEIKLLQICKESGMHVSIVRPSLVYGPNVKGNLKLMLSGIEKGWFPPLPETHNKRSMIHVDDLVRAILLVAEEDRAHGEIFIATDGKPYSSREIYIAMCVALGKPIARWSVPKSLFGVISLISPHVKYKLSKLLGDECYSSKKLEKLGFKAQRALCEMNQTFL